ncbi:MAG: lysostaphin resistance A-like protein [Lachnospiraceae bacterium]
MNLKDNSLVTKWFYILAPIIIYSFVKNLGIFIGVYGIQMIRENGMNFFGQVFEENSMFFLALIQIFSVLLAICFVVFSFKDEERIKEKKYITISIFDVIRMICLSVTSSLAINILFSISEFTQSSSTYTQVATSQFSLPLFMGILLYGIVTPFAEEMVFRGIVFNRMNRYFGLKMGMIGSSLLFGMFHGNIVQGIYAVILGFLMVSMYEKYNRFYVPVVIHGIANTGIYCIMYFNKLQELIFTVPSLIVNIVCVIILIYLEKKKKSDNK